jgi:hypothetical protein
LPSGALPACAKARRGGLCLSGTLSAEIRVGNAGSRKRHEAAGTKALPRKLKIRGCVP